MDDSRVKQSVDTIEQVFRLLRDAALGSLFVLLIAFPSYLNRRLTAAGFTKIQLGGSTWEKQVQAANEQTKVAATTVSGATQALQAVNDQLSNAALQSKNPDVKAAIEKSILQLHGTLTEVNQADRTLQETVLTQQDVLAQSGSGNQRGPEGWLYIGGTDEARARWMEGSPKNVLPVSLPLNEGQTIFSSGLNYLRGDPSTKQHKDAGVTAAIRDRTQLQIESIDYSHAIAGGWFIWIKVKAK